MSLGELLQRDEQRREEKVRERGRAAARSKAIKEAEAEEAARRAAKGSEGAKTHEGGRHVLSGEYRMADGQAVRKTAESYRTLR